MSDVWLRTVDIDAAVRKRVEVMVDHMANDPSWNGFDTAILRSIELQDVDEQRRWVAFDLTVTDALCNKMGNLHGGAASLVMDVITSLAVNTISREGFWENTGVSRTLSVTFLRPVSIGTKIRIEAEVVHAGSRLAHITGRILRAKDGALCVTCVHDKSVAEAPKAKI